MQDLRKLLAGSPGAVIIARRLTPAELKVFERRAGGLQRGRARAIVNKEGLRFRHPGRSGRMKTLTATAKRHLVADCW